jgi:hypothetical protein
MTIQPQPDTHRAGRWLTVARVAWLVVMAAAIVNMILDVPYAYTAIVTLSDYGRPVGWSGEVMQASLAGLGLTPSGIAIWQIVIAGMMSVAYGAVAILIMWRRPNDRMALFVGFFFAAMGGVPLVGVSYIPIIQPNPDTYFLRAGLGWLAWTSLLAFSFFFPNGRFVPRRLWPVVVGWAGQALLWSFFADTPLSPLKWPGGLLAFTMSIGLGAAVVAQVYRYRFASTPLERQQLKWMMFITGVNILGILIPLLVLESILQPLRAPGPNALGFILLFDSLFYLALISLPVALAFILLRYRLWDIDLLIRRTLQYSIISSLLALTYFGLVIVLQRLFAAVTGQQSAVAIVLSTLAIAALFNPVRRRVQDAIDRRFYRKKYDAAKVIADFAATCRDETDLDKLTARLVEVVDETMQPETVSLWLKKETGKHGNK